MVFAILFQGIHKIEGPAEKMYLAIQRSEDEWEVLVEKYRKIQRIHFKTNADQAKKYILSQIVHREWKDFRYEIISPDTWILNKLEKRIKEESEENQALTNIQEKVDTHV